jgi:uncharacterized membrane protein YtjA (UPF0391 family)
VATASSEQPGVSDAQHVIGGGMLCWCLASSIALLASALGFGGIAGTAALIAKILFVVFIVLFVAMLLRGRKA